MVRHSSIDENSRSAKAWRSLRSQRRGPHGEGMDYRLFRDVPEGPPLAKFLRRYVTLREALLRLRAESPKWQPAQKPFFRAGCSAVLTGLGSYPWNYEAAEKCLHEWCWRIFRENGFRDGEVQRRSFYGRPQVAVAGELWDLISQLIIAYADPHRFFKEIAPDDAPDDFDVTKISSPLFLGRTLWRWGFGALLNADVRRAFDSATPNQLTEIIGLAEGRGRYRDGPPPGSGKGKAKKKRGDLVGTKLVVNADATDFEKATRQGRGGTKHAIAKIAKAEKVSPAAIQKRMTRASNK